MTPSPLLVLLLLLSQAVAHFGTRQGLMLPLTDAGRDEVCAWDHEYGTVYLECPPRRSVERVLFASFGGAGVMMGMATGDTVKRGTGSECADYKAHESCHLDVRDYVEQRCLGEHACSLSASDSAHSDPCPGFQKSLAVSVSCGVQSLHRDAVNTVSIALWQAVGCVGEPPRGLLAKWRRMDPTSVHDDAYNYCARVAAGAASPDETAACCGGGGGGCSPAHCIRQTYGLLDSTTAVSGGAHRVAKLALCMVVVGDSARVGAAVNVLLQQTVAMGGLAMQQNIDPGAPVEWQQICLGMPDHAKRVLVDAEGALLHRADAVIPSGVIIYDIGQVANHGHASFADAIWDNDSPGVLSTLRCELCGLPSRQHRGYDTTPATGLLAAFAVEPSFVPPASFKVLALVSGFNEADVIEAAILHYLMQGCSVHYIDNWSTDDTLAVVIALQQRWLRGLVHNSSTKVTLTYETFPEADTKTYDWERILQHKEELAAGAADYDWVVHGDADEIRESAWGDGVLLRQGFFIAQVLGFNMVNFDKLLVFHPVHGVQCSEHGACDMYSTLQYWDQTIVSGDKSQVKAWRNYPRNAVDTNEVDLSSTGGHEANYRSLNIERRIFPWSFVLRHYPIRSQAHGVRKVFAERKARWSQFEHDGPLRWHKQYDHITDKKHNFLKSKDELELAPGGHFLWPADVYDTELPCLSGPDWIHRSISSLLSSRTSRRTPLIY